MAGPLKFSLGGDIRVINIDIGDILDVNHVLFNFDTPWSKNDEELVANLVSHHSVQIQRCESASLCAFVYVYLFVRWLQVATWT